MGPLIGNSQTQLLWSRYHSELSLTVANEGAHIFWEHLKHTPIWGVSRPPLPPSCTNLTVWPFGRSFHQDLHIFF